MAAGMSNPDAIEWTDDAVQYLRDNWERLSAMELARTIGTGHTRLAIIGKARRLGLVSKEQNPKLGRPVQYAAPVKRRGPASLGKMGLATTSMDERCGGMGSFKRVVIREVSIDVPDYECVGVPDVTALRPHQCCWPLDAGGFCGNDKYRGEKHKNTSYCLIHMKQSISSHHYRGGYWATHR